MSGLTTQQAAERLGVTTARIRAMILSGRLPAEKFGHVHLIREEDLALVADRKPGRPKTKNDDIEPPAAPAITAAEMKTGDTVKTKPAAKKPASKKAGN